MNLILGPSKIVFGYTQEELIKLIKQMLSLNEKKKVVMAGRQGRATVFFTGDINIVRDEIRKFLGQSELTIVEESDIILPEEP